MNNLVYEGFSKTTDTMSASEAVVWQVQNYGFSEGRIERLEERIETLSGIVGRFLARSEALGLSASEIAEIIGHNWRIA